MHTSCSLDGVKGFPEEANMVRFSFGESFGTSKKHITVFSFLKEAANEWYGAWSFVFTSLIFSNTFGPSRVLNP